MNTVVAKALKKSQRVNGEGFTLLELLAVLGVIAVLITLQLPALAGAKSQSKIAICASHVRQLALACQIYANENNDKLPVLANSSGQGVGAWAWDVPAATVNKMLNSGTTPATFYCPGTAPRFTDAQNWAGPNPSGQTFGANSTLWNFGVTANPPNLQSDFHIVGYALALSGPASKLTVTNQNTTIQPERITDHILGISIVTATSDRVLVADAIISSGAILPGYLHPENNYVSIAGGFQWNGMSYPHVSPHLKGNVPAGGNLGFKDGHVDWRKFELMTPRTASGTTFWW